MAVPEVSRDMAGRRRIWTLKQKLAIVAELERCDYIVTFARRHDVRTSLLYIWWRELRYAVAARQVSDNDGDHARIFAPVVSEARRLRELESENAKLKSLLADAMLDQAALKDLI